MRPSAREAPWHRSSVGLGRGIGAFLVLAVVAAGGSPLQAQANGDGQAQGNAAGDRAALVALYNATDGPNWVDNTNWLTDQPLSQWRGVITDGEGRVFGLLLYGNGLSGKLPVELGKLTRLTNLLLRDNDLSGPIPAELGNLTELLFLSLGGNGLSGSIPAELGNLTRLQRLDLRKNDLSGPIPAELGKLTRLSSLNLDGNRLSGAFPPELAALGRLEHLDLGQNARLAGTLPEALRDISALRRLDAEGTRLCAPGDAPFQEWLGTINFLGHNCRPYSGDSSLSVIDIAVFYTPAVARRYSNRPYGYQRFRAQIDLMFAGANQAFTDSGVYVELSLVGLEEVRYQERPDPVTVHRHFHGNYDGEMDEIHAERNSVGADIAVLVFESAEKYASAQVGSGFSTFSMQAMTPYSLAHEIGHNMGLLHDRHVSGRNWIYPYGHGYVNQRAFHESAEPRARWMTIMAYPNQCEEAGFECRPVMRFSNPDHEFRGDPLGAAGDNEDQRPADAVRALNEYRKTVANWRTRPEGLDPSAVTVTFDPPEITVAEGESATLRVRLSRSMGHPVTVSLSHGAGQFAGGSEGSDYSALPSSVTFESDQTEVPIEIQSIDDSLVEGAEGVVLEISESNLPWGLMIGSNPTATVSIQDNDLPQGPVVTTGPALVVEEGQTAVATLAATDTDTPATQLTWSIPAGSAGGTDGHLFALSAGGQLAFLAAKDYESPDDSDQDGTYEVTVQVTDGATPVTAAIQVRLANRNEAPTADAGADQSNVAEGASVTLAGSGTDPDADDVAGTLQFLWRQSDTGPHRVTLSNSNAASATFTAPSGLTADAVLRFALTVTDDGNLSGEDEVEVTVRRSDPPQVSISASSDQVAEGAPVAFEVTLDKAAPEALTVAVSVTENGSALSGTPPASLAFAKGATSATLSVPTAGDTVVESDSIVTATVTAGTGYTIGSTSSSAVTVKDDDAATFTVSAVPEAIAEGESATLTVAISNGVSFAEAQTISLAASGTASASDYTGVPPTLTLAAGVASVTATLAASADQEEEDAETVTVTASHGGSTIGSATVTINSISRDATLATLSLSGVDIGTFSGSVTSYHASVPNSVTSTTVTATASHSGAIVSIDPGSEVALAEGANQIRVTVTAGDGTTRKNYTVTVTRAVLPVVSIAAVEGRARGPIGEVTASRTGPTAEPLDVQVRMTNTRTTETRTLTFRFLRGQSTMTRQVQASDNKLVEDDFTVTWTLLEGEGYAVSGEHASASVVLEESDVPEFSVTVQPAKIWEGESATVKVATTNGVTFAKDQTISLAASGTASASEYTGLPPTLTLPAGASSVTATLAASPDQEEEDAETVTVTASHEGSEIGSATVTIAASESPLPLTAEFAGMPATHDGETEFTFQLRFSEKINIRNEKLRDTAFEVTGGSVRGVRRVRNPPRHLNRRWRITVEPASDADVVLALPVTTDCKAKRAVCTPGGKGLSQRVTATVKGPSEVEAAGFPLAPENSRPSGIWSDGQTAWVADLDNARLYAYRRSDGEREPDRDIATEPAPMGLWSDGETLWVAGLGGGLRAHRLSDGTRQAWRDLALEANTVPAGVWSDGQTAWVADWLGDTVHAYRLSDGRRVADREIKLDGGNLLPVGLWSDGETLWVADWREWVYAYRLSDGGRDPARDVVAARADTDPTGLWSSGELLLATGWEDGQVRAYRLPTAESPAQGKDQSGGLPARAASIPPVADPALRAAIGAALGKAPGESVGGEELARLESLEARDAGIRDLAGLESATSLTVLDLGFNPLADLRPLAALPALEHLNLDGAIPDLQDLAALTGLKRLSLRHNGIRNLGILAGLTRLEELDAGDNLIEDLRPLSGLGQLEVLRADRNRIADLWPLASLARLEVLELGSNRIGDLQPLAGLAGLRKLRLAGNQFAELHPLSGLDGLTDLGLAGNAVEDLRALSDLGGLRRLDLRGNPVGDLRPLQALRSLAWVHVGGTRIEDLAPLNGVPSLTVAGRDDLRPPEAVGGGAENSNRD